MEIWKDVIGYEGYYMVSNLGRVKSLERYKNNKSKKVLLPERILIQHNSGRYLKTHLCKDGIPRAFHTHRLVMFAFKGVSSLNVDHINGDSFDNRLENLRYCTQRENMTFSNVKRQRKSQYQGVHYNKQTGRWKARFFFNKKEVHIGYYDDEYSAHLAYKSKLSELLNI